MAISALQAQEAKTQLSAEGTTSDLISRQDAIDVCDNAIDLWHGQLGEGIVIAVKKKIEELLPAQPEIEKRTEEFAQNVPKEDLISRKAAIDVLATMQGLCTSKAALVQNSKIWQQIKDLPSAQPKRKTGRWLIREGISDAQCSECGMYFNDVYDMDNSDAFCRHCGAKMEGLKVVEDERFDQQTGGD